ncbi:kynureninase [Erythrobacter sp. W53]|uniref:kynureninase n=1 Tax=Erythrobacter sp. W53 TaxID=3425947 RepID=UPI003D767418
MTSLADRIAELDANDPLREFRDEFQLRDGLIYLDGNSLGAVPKATAAAMQDAVTEQWGEGLITSWLGADWVNSPRRIGDKIAGLIGAKPGEVIAANSTSVNIFKALGAALSLQKGRTVILTEEGNFPTDHYMMQGLECLSGGTVQSLALPAETVLDRLDEDVAVLLLTQVHYKSGVMRDMAAINAAAHTHGVLVIWDLSHSTGAVEVDLDGSKADFAIGCGYKFLNGGPGAPAYIYVAERHQHADAVLAGWFGHARPFAFEERYEAASGIERFLCGTPPILGMVALEEGVDLIAKADMRAVRAKSVALAQLLIELMKPLCEEFGFTLASPEDRAVAGSHVSYAHEQAYAITQALKEHDVIGDFRAPDVVRLGLTPLYLRYADIADAVARMREVCETRSWDRPEFRERASVT